MQLVQRHIINRNHSYWRYFDQQCFLSKNLFNLTNYEMRQHFFSTKSVLGFTELYHKVSKTDAYYSMPNTKVAKQVIRRIHKAWLGYKAAHKDWQKNPHKYLGEPKLPKYKHKEKGRYMLVFPIETVSKPYLRKGIVKLTPCPIEIKTGLQHGSCSTWGDPSLTATALPQVVEVRVIPRSGCYVIEVVFNCEKLEKTTGSVVAGLDIGLVNLATLTTNQSGVKPLLIKGGALKAINTYYNKKKAKLQSALELRHKTKTSNRVNGLTHKRNCRIDNYLHTTSRRIIDWCMANQINTLVIGKNEGWKQSINIGKRNNQQFVNVPHTKLIDQIIYKATLAKRHFCILT